MSTGSTRNLARFLFAAGLRARELRLAFASLRKFLSSPQVFPSFNEVLRADPSSLPSLPHPHLCPARAPTRRSHSRTKPPTAPENIFALVDSPVSPTSPLPSPFMVTRFRQPMSRPSPYAQLPNPFAPTQLETSAQENHARAQQKYEAVAGGVTQLSRDADEATRRALAIEEARSWLSNR